MTKGRIRILVDTSRDTGWSNGLIRMEPDSIYQTTNNRDYLNEAVLKNYDVLTICSNTLLKYTDAERQLIHEFVENGGGLLLATSTSRFERDVREPISELGINHIASLFGARFLPLPEGQGEMDTDANPLRGYTKKDLCLTDHEVVNGLEIDDFDLTYCSILDVPADGNVFLEHSGTAEPVGTCLHFGLGRVLLINTQLFQQENHPISRKFIDWLGINREETHQQKPSLATDTETIPDEIPINEQVKQDEKIKIFYTHFVEDRVDTCMEFAKKLAKEMLSKFPEGEKIEWKIDLVPSCVHKYGFGWEDSVMTIGAHVSPPRLAYSLGVEASGLIADKTPFGKTTDVLFDGFQFFFGIWAMKLLGFETEAVEMITETERQFRENAQTEELIDIAKIYEQRFRKPIWILKTLLEKYGDDLFVRFAEMFSEKESSTEKNMPRTTFSKVDSLIYCLNRVVGEDLFPWFEEIGTTVHPLPLLPNNSDEFVAAVRGHLNEIIRDMTADTSDRTDAIDSLLDIADESEHKVSALVAKLDAADRYERLIAAAELVKSLDDRAVKVLEKLTVEAGDDGLVAMAVLMLARNGRVGEVIDRLVGIAPHQDHRYQLETGYLLEKIGHPAAERFSYKRLSTKDGTPLLTMDIERDRDLHLYPTIGGYRVSTCNSILHTHHFPHNTHAPGIYVSWVHTKSAYRRKGFARWAFGVSMTHELVRQYSCISLHTGTGNDAHGMYRDFGFIDGLLARNFTKALRREQAKVVEGLVVRPYTPGDEVAMANVLNAFYVDRVERRPRRAERRRTSETRLIYLAEKDGDLLGYLQAQCEKEKNVLITEFCLKSLPSEGTTHPEGFLEDVGAALLCALHNELVKREYKRIHYEPEPEGDKEHVRTLFHNFGYTSSDAGWVWMFKIINLPMLLRELSPLLSKRLNESDTYKGWEGTIGIKGLEHHASLTIKDDEIRVSAEVSEGTGICLSTDDDTITRFILGVITPYGAYLQNQLHIAPTVNSSVAGLLGTLFPKH